MDEEQKTIILKVLEVHIINPDKVNSRPPSANCPLWIATTLNCFTAMKNLSGKKVVLNGS